MFLYIYLYLLQQIFIYLFDLLIIYLYILCFLTCWLTFLRTPLRPSSEHLLRTLEGKACAHAFCSAPHRAAAAQSSEELFGKVYGRGVRRGVRQNAQSM